MRFSITCLSVLFLVALSACKDKYDPDAYLSASVKDSTLADIITYLYIKPNGATNQGRFDLRFRSYYVQQLDKFELVYYYISNDGLHHFYVVRPARGLQGVTRGAGGVFKKDSSGKITAFREVFNTPIANKEDLVKRGRELFLYMLKNGNVDGYKQNPDYIQWPDETTYYDTLNYEWTVKAGV